MSLTTFQQMFSFKSLLNQVDKEIYDKNLKEIREKKKKEQDK